jgi:hypothetical protein
MPGIGRTIVPAERATDIDRELLETAWFNGMVVQCSGWIALSFIFPEASGVGTLTARFLVLPENSSEAGNLYTDVIIGTQLVTGWEREIAARREEDTGRPDSSDGHSQSHLGLLRTLLPRARKRKPTFPRHTGTETAEASQVTRSRPLLQGAEGVSGRSASTREQEGHSDGLGMTKVGSIDLQV